MLKQFESIFCFCYNKFIMQCKSLSILILVFLIIAVPSVNAGQVTMAAYDFDDDSYEEIIRTDEKEGVTFIRIYKRISGSYFYEPFQQFKLTGRLVQVPEILDVNKDGLNDYFFATGTDMGVLYYDIIKDTFVQTNSFDFDISGGEYSESGEVPDAVDVPSPIVAMQKELDVARQTDFEMRELKSIFSEDVSTHQPMKRVAPKRSIDPAKKGSTDFSDDEDNETLTSVVRDASYM